MRTAMRSAPVMRPTSRPVSGLGVSFVAPEAVSSAWSTAQDKSRPKSVSTRLSETPAPVAIAPHARDIGRGKRQTGGAAPARRSLHVREIPCGTWVVSTVAGVVCSQHETDVQATVWTRGVLRRAGGGELIVHGARARLEHVAAAPID